jgi:hydrogenase nickel incorporation protein HypA/HybF
MHETSLMASLLNRVGEELTKLGAARVLSIRVSVGELAGVDPRLLEIAFRQLTVGTPADGACFDVEIVPVTAVCESCRARFTVYEFHFRCPDCGSGRTQAVAGEQVLLESLTVGDPSELDGAFVS